MSEADGIDQARTALARAYRPSLLPRRLRSFGGET